MPATTEPEQALILEPPEKVGKVYRWLVSYWLGWVLGLISFLAYVSWLTLSSRLPGLALLLVVLGVSGTRFALKTPVRARSWIVRILKPEFLALAAILLLAIGLRFIGIQQSLPYLDNPDEPTTVSAAIQMLQTGDLNPHFFRWPSFPFYTQFVLSVVQFLSGVANGTFSNLNQLVPDSFYLAGRVLSATLGVATVFLTYLLGRTLYNKAVGLLGAFILAILPLHSEHSKYVTPDVMVAFFATLTLLFAAYIYKTGQRKWYLWAGVAAGLTIGTKYNVAVVLVSVVLAHFLADKKVRGKLSWLLATLGTAIGVFLLTTPFIVFDLTGFLNEMAFQVRHYTIEGHGNASEGASWLAYLGYLFNEAFVYQGIIAVVGGIGLVLFRQRREDWLVLSLPAVGYLFFSSAIVHFSRNLMPLLPPLAILSACFILWLTKFPDLLIKRVDTKVYPYKEGGNLPTPIPQPPAPRSFILHPTSFILLFRGVVSSILSVVILCLVLFGFSLRNSFETTRYYTQPDSRSQAGVWIVQNIPAGKKIRLERYTPYLPSSRFPGADEQRPIGARPLGWYQEQGYDYLVASSYEYKELIANDRQAAENYRSVFDKGQLIAQFPGDSPDHPGPTIKIYRIR